MLKTNYDDFIFTAKNLLSCLDIFGNECRNNNPKEIAENLSSKDIEIIQELFTSGIKVYYLFEVILRYDKTIAQSLLVNNYIGHHVCPDTKGRGYEAEISSMLEDYYDIEGYENMISWLKSDEISLKRLMDKRVLRSLSNILNINESALKELISK